MSSDVFVSVVMPVRNEEGFIARSLKAVLNQDYPPELIEILVIDGLSEDRTLEIIQALPGNERVSIIANPQRIQAAGLNKALRRARGDIILRVDGHTIIAPDYVRQCVAALKETGAYNVGGPMEPVGLTSIGQAIAGATKTSFAVPGAFHTGTYTGQYTDTVYMGAWPRWVLEDVGGFDEHLAINEDYELNYRIRQMGGRIYLSPAIHSSYFGRQTLPALALQYFSYGKGKTTTLKKYPRSLRVRQLVAPCFVGACIGGLPLSIMLPEAGWLWLLMLLTYFAAMFVFSCSAAKRTGYKLFWLFPPVFLTIHMSWGLGFWAGFLSGALRSGRKPATAHNHSALLEDA